MIDWTEADHTIIWRRLDRPGHEYARLFNRNSQHHLAGTAVFVFDDQPCRLDYLIVCNARWHSLSGRVIGWIGPTPVEVELTVDSVGRWRLNGEEAPEATGCIDLDLNFSPSTNLLPIRRLNLAVGEEARVRAAWLRFPSLTLEPLEQLYHRTKASTYRYESSGGRFVAELRVNGVGFVTRYPDLWEVESGK